MNTWLARTMMFFIAGGGCFLSLHYASSHFKPERQLILLNRTRPDFQYLIKLQERPNAAASKQELKEYIDYFRLVTEAMPDNSDGHLMLGYLEGITGDRGLAGKLFNEAFHLDPSFFFNLFNQALMCFDQGEYAQSTELLQKALAIPPQQTLKRMTGSVIYLQIFASMQNKHAVIDDLQQAYHDAYVLFMESSARQKGAPQADAGPQVDAHIM